jgi:cholesterol transport system auxiliary component
VSRKSAVAATAVLAIAALGLSGCISLFPKSNPAQLYRFGAAEAGAAAADAARPVEVIKGGVEFNRAAAGDRILTVNGTELAYIKDARWVAPAATLFDEAYERAFASAPDAPRLTGMGRASKAAGVLRLDVDAFETRYDQGMEAAPLVVVHIRASMISTRDRRLIGDHAFESRVRASDNRVSAIVQAYDAASADALGKLAGWAGQAARSAG